MARELKSKKQGSLDSSLKILQSVPELLAQEVEGMGSVFMQESTDVLFTKVRAAYQDVIQSIGLYHSAELASDTAMLTRLLRLMQQK